MFYVYAYCDPRKPSTFVSGFEPFYIGKGTKNRAFQHLQSGRKNNNKFFTNKIQKICSLGLEPIVHIVENNLTEDRAFQLEVELISKFGMYPNGCLCNLTEGGIGGRLSEVSISKISATLSGSKLTEETKQKISASLIGKHRDEETKSKISSTLKGATHSQERRQNLSNAIKNKFSNLHNLQRYIIFDNDQPFATLFGNEAITDLGFSEIYNSLRTGKPISRGKFKGWKIIKALYPEVLQYEVS